MEEQDLWKRYVEHLKIYPKLGFSLDISRMRFSDMYLNNISHRLESAIEEMSALESGSIANPDEKRMVGHYWLRAPELSPNKEIQEEIQSGIISVGSFSKSILSGEIKAEQGVSFNKALLIGIGGSALGPQLVSDALGEENSSLDIYFSDNTDPDGIARTLRKIGSALNQTLVIVVSKSGGTVETRNGLLEVSNEYRRKGLNFSKHAVAITCRGSKLDQIAEKDSWLNRFYIWDWVGGRTSLFSAVGLLPAALEGIDIDELLSGAREMDELTRRNDPLKNPASLMAAMWYYAGKGKGEKDMVVLPYKDRLGLFGKYLQQLIMESLGKEKDLSNKIINQGLAVYGNKGSTDQHAYVQQLRDGLNNFFVTFIEVLSDYSSNSKTQSEVEVEPGITSGDYLTGFYLGTRSALYENQRESISISLDSLNPKSLGALIALYERTVGLYANLIHVNAYHQPGVEAGKKAAGRIIEIQTKLLGELKARSAEEGASAKELSEAIGEPDEVESIYKILEHLSLNPGRGVVRVSESRHPTEARYKNG